MKNKAVVIAIFVWQKAASYGQSKVYEILQYVSKLQSSAADHYVGGGKKVK